MRAVVGLGALILVGGLGTGCSASEADARSDAAAAECVHADYALEPTFDDPEQALADALATETSVAPMPGSVAQYERVERSDGSIDFGFRASDDDHVTWTVAQDGDGQWGAVAVSACTPARS